MKGILLIAFMVFSAVTASAQEDFVEVRAGITREGVTYRYFDYSHTFKNDIAIDMAVYNEPGSSEAWVGIGKYIKKGNFTTLVAGYLVAGTAQNELGVGLVNYGVLKSKKINLEYTVTGFIPVRGGVHKYLTIDTLDVTKSVSKRVDVGVSTGAFFIDKESNLIAGPVVKINDKYGTTSFSLRGGAYTEFRIGRTFTFHLFGK